MNTKEQTEAMGQFQAALTTLNAAFSTLTRSTPTVVDAPKPNKRNLLVEVLTGRELDITEIVVELRKAGFPFYGRDV